MDTDDIPKAIGFGLLFLVVVPLVAALAFAPAIATIWGMHLIWPISGAEAAGWRGLACFGGFFVVAMNVIAVLKALLD